jgi:hypothetical protein
VNALKVNPSTGFLESDSIRAFTSDDKVKLLSMVRSAAENNEWPRVSDICKQLGIGSQTFYNHLEFDPNFKREYEEAMAPVEDQLAANLHKQGLNANGITANIFLLKSRWRKRWGENNLVVNVDPGSIKELLSRSAGVIDGEIVEKPKELNDKAQ